MVLIVVWIVVFGQTGHFGLDGGLAILKVLLREALGYRIANMAVERKRNACP